MEPETPAIQGPVGLWNLGAVILGETELSPAALGVDMSLELRDDGSAVLSTNGKSAEGSWIIDGNAVTVSAKGRDLSFMLEGGTLCGEWQVKRFSLLAGGITICFVPAE